jgi:hypothetical protein
MSMLEWPDKYKVPDMGVYSVDKLITEARRIAAEYRRATGKPLAGVTSEVCQYDAARLLDLELGAGVNGGYDAVGRGTREGKKIQIKGRAIFDESKSGQRIGQLKMEQDWDSVVLVLMDENLEPYEIYEAGRDEIIAALGEGVNNKRSKRGIMSVAKFRAIGHLAWSRDYGAEDEELWENHPDDI